MERSPSSRRDSDELVHLIEVARRNLWEAQCDLEALEEEYDWPRIRKAEQVVEECADELEVLEQELYGWD